MNTVANAEAQPDVLKALRSLGGRGTLGDVVSSVGLPRDQVESTLNSLLETHEGHLAASATQRGSFSPNTASTWRRNGLASHVAIVETVPVRAPRAVRPER